MLLHSTEIHQDECVQCPRGPEEQRLNSGQAPLIIADYHIVEADKMITFSAIRPTLGKVYRTASRFPRTCVRWA